MLSTLNVALTGASGFVGGHILTQLLMAGHKVRALVRNPARFEPKVSDAKLSVIAGDLFDDRVLAELVDGADVVIHVVGIIREVPRRGQTFERVHAMATRRLLSAAKKAAVGRWVHMSALGSRPNAVSRYHLSKWEAETSVRQSGLEYTIFRPSIIHGPDGEFMEMVKRFWYGRFPPFVPYFGNGWFGGGGAGRLQPVWVEDVAQCFNEAMTSDKSVNETYGMGGPDMYTWPQFYETCRKHLPRARRKKVRAVPVWYAKLIAGKPGVPFNRDQVVMSQEDSLSDIGKVQSDFGFKMAPFEPTFAEYANRIA